MPSRSQRHKMTVQGQDSRGDNAEDYGAYDATLAPTLASISPTTRSKAAGVFTLTATGTKYDAECVINFAGAYYPTTLISATQVSASIDPAAMSTGSKTVFVSKTRYPNTGNQTLTLNA